MDMSEIKCKYKPKWNPIPIWFSQCREDPLSDDFDSYCILHSIKEDKDLAEFMRKVDERINTPIEPIGLMGCYFPKNFNRFYFRNRHFKRPVSFIEARFAQKVDFTNVRFELPVFFAYAEFLEEVDFTIAKFERVTDFRDAKFYRGVKFLGAEFFLPVNFTKTIFQGHKTDFRDTKFRDVKFLDTKFKTEETSFIDTRFIEETEFNNPHFEGQVYFSRTRFEKSCKFLWTEFPRTHQQVVFQDVDLSNCSFPHSNIEKVDFRNCRFGEAREYFIGILPIQRHNVLLDEREAKTDIDLNMACRLYRDLVKNYDDKGDRHMATDFYYREMECKRKQMGRWGRYLSLHAFSWQITGYGVRLERSLFFIFLLFGVSCFFYKCYEGLSWSNAFINSLFGINVLTASIYNQVYKPSCLGQCFFWFEAVAGTFLTAVFALTLQRVFTPFK